MKLKLPFTLDKRVTIGELITVFSILFSALSVLNSWREEQKLQRLEHATRSRIEIAKTLNKVNQVIQIQLSFYELIEEDIVEASRIAIVDNEPIRARDHIWEKCFKHRADILNLIAQNDWEIAYTNLLTYGISADSLYLKSVKRLKSVQDNQYKLILDALQYEFESIYDKSATYPTTSVLIDKLRVLKDSFKDEHKKFAELAARDFSVFCLEQIKESDKALLELNNFEDRIKTSVDLMKKPDKN